VHASRDVLKTIIGASELQFLDQVHGVGVVKADSGSARNVPEADAMWTTEPRIALCIQTADCVPVMIASGDGTVIGAAHAGWRGVAANIVAVLVRQLPVAAGQLHAWIGPSISGACYEVGDEVREAMRTGVAAGILDAACIQGRSPGKWWLDLPMIVRRQLVEAGVARTAISDSGSCTFSDAARFFSYRRDGRTGRLTSFILRSV
jgi:hypothetical protein